MKRIICLLLALCVVSATFFTACGGIDTPADDGKQQEQTTPSDDGDGGEQDGNGQYVPKSNETPLVPFN